MTRSLLWFARVVIRYPWRVLAVAGLVAVLMLPMALGLFGRTVFGEYVVPGSDSVRAAEVLREREDGTLPDLIAVVAPRSPRTSDAEVRSEARALAASLARRTEVAGLASAWEPGDPHRLRFKDQRSGAIRILLHGDPVQRRHNTQTLVDAYGGGNGSRYGELQVRFTGPMAVLHEGDVISQAELHRLELLAAAPTAVLLLLCFGSLLAALLPLLVAGLALLCTAAVLWAAAGVTAVPGPTFSVMSCLGLGLAVDYCLFLLYRYRRQRANGDEVSAAVTTTVLTTGRMALYSALVVSLSMLALLVFPIDYLRALGIGGAALALLCALTALCVLPPLLVLLGPRLDTRGRGLLRSRTRSAGAPGRWQRLAVVVVRRPLLVLVGALVPVLLMAYPLTQARFEAPDATALPAGAAARQAAEQLGGEERAVGLPVAVAVPGPAADRRQIDAYARQLAQIPGAVRTVVEPQGHQVLVFSRHPPGSADAIRLAERLRGVPGPPSGAYLGGPAVQALDVRNVLLGRLPWALTAAAATTLFIIFLFTRSVLLPLKAVLLNLLSLGAGLGMVVWIFQQGHLLWFASGAQDMVVAVVLAVIAFGVSMDYEMLLLGQVQEHWLRHGDTRQAIVQGLGASGGLVTSAAAILIVSFLAFMTSALPSMRLTATGLAVTLAVDATLVRGLLAPAMMRLAGRWNWWRPRRLPHPTARQPVDQA